MGSGASSGVAETLKSAPDEEVKAALSACTPEARSKMKAALESAGGGAGGGDLTDGVVTLCPYFKLKDAAKFKQIWKDDYKNFAHKEDCTHYAFCFTDDDTRAHCREAYPNAEKVLQHLTDVKEPLDAVLAGPAELERLEAHGPKDELDKLRDALAPLGCLFYVAEWGFRTDKPEMPQDTVCHLYPYFKMKNPSEFKKIWKAAYPDTQANAEAEKSFQYAFSFESTEGVASCRESYGDADGILLHLKNVDTALKAVLDGPAELLRLEVHAPPSEILKLKPALEPLGCQFFNIEWGFRNAVGKGSGIDGDDYPPKGLAASIRKLEEWIQVGCGDKPYNCAEKNATFAVDGLCPADMPDLSKHSNFMAEKLTADMYAKLKDVKTASGCTLAECMKTGVDNPGHPHIKTVGLVACDEECYTTFAEIFDPVIDARHGGYAPDAKQPTNLDTSKLSTTDIDPALNYVLTTRVRTGRSVRGFQLPPVISFEKRRELEALVVKALLTMGGELKGDYFPLNGSRSYPPKPNGMSEAEEEQLRSAGNLFQEPDSTLLLASGMGRHWPDGRGIFKNDAANLFVWLNEEDHLRIVSMQGSRDKPSEEGKNIAAVTARFINACDEVNKVLKANGSEFMHNDHLGFVLTCPSNLGTGLRAGTMVKLPKVSARDDWKKLCAVMKLQARGTGGVDSANVGGTWDVSNADRIGTGEVDLVNVLIEGAAQLVKWETMMDNGEEAKAAEEITAKIGGC
jgi:creatine kinase